MLNGVDSSKDRDAGDLGVITVCMLGYYNNIHTGVFLVLGPDDKLLSIAVPSMPPLGISPI